MNNDISKDAAEEFRLWRTAAHRWDADSEAGDTLRSIIREAIQRATAADKERIAELEANLLRLRFNSDGGVDDCPKCGGIKTLDRHNYDWKCLCGYSEVRKGDA